MYNKQTVVLLVHNRASVRLSTSCADAVADGNSRVSPVSPFSTLTKYKTG